MADSVAPSPGTAESARRDKVTWQKELAAHFNKFKRYPACLSRMPRGRPELTEIEVTPAIADRHKQPSILAAERHPDRL